MQGQGRVSLSVSLPIKTFSETPLGKPTSICTPTLNLGVRLRAERDGTLSVSLDGSSLVCGRGPTCGAGHTSILACASNRSPMVSPNVTRRELLKLGVTAAAAEIASLLLHGCGGPSAGVPPAQLACSKLTDIQHVVIIIQENRSFDHYFGSYRV